MILVGPNRELVIVKMAPPGSVKTPAQFALQIRTDLPDMRTDIHIVVDVRPAGHVTGQGGKIEGTDGEIGIGSDGDCTQRRVRRQAEEDKLVFAGLEREDFWYKLRIRRIPVAFALP